MVDFNKLTSDNFLHILCYLNLKDLTNIRVANKSLKDCIMDCQNRKSSVVKLRSRLFTENNSKTLENIIIIFPKISNFAIVNFKKSKYYLSHSLDALFKTESICASLTNLTITVKCIQGKSNNLAEIGNLRLLKSLDLSNSSISQDGMRNIIKLSQLESLNLSFCTSMFDSKLGLIKKLTNLRSLNISGCKDISNCCVKEILRKIELLKQINFSFCSKLSNEIFLIVSKLEDISEMNLSDCNRKLNLLSPLLNMEQQCLTSFKRLQTLNVSCIFDIINNSLLQISYITSLTALNLSYCWRIEDEGLSYLSTLIHLNSLDISFCYSLQNINVISEIMSILPIETIYLIGLSDITDFKLNSTPGQPLILLKNLHLVSCSSLKLESSFKSLYNLTNVDFSYCTSLQDKDVKFIANLTNLISLNLCYCLNISDLGLSHLMLLSKLRCLDLSFCENITDEGISYLGNLVNIEILDLYNCNNLSDQGLLYCSKLINICWLDLSFCNLITNIGLSTSLKCLQKIKILNLSKCSICVEIVKSSFPYLSVNYKNPYLDYEFIYINNEYEPIERLNFLKRNREEINRYRKTLLSDKPYTLFFD